MQLDLPLSLAHRARIAAGAVGKGVLIFYCSDERRPSLCQATWQGPGQWTSGRVACGGLSEKPVRPRSLAAIFDGKASGIAYVSSEDGALWEVKAPGSPFAGQEKAWCMTDKEYSSRALRRIAEGPVVAGPLPRSRAEGGGLAGSEVVVVRGDGKDSGNYLHRFFIGGAGCGALEGRGIGTWQMQYLTMADEGFRSPALASDSAAGPAVCVLATAGGTHHIFYASVDGAIVEL